MIFNSIEEIKIGLLPHLDQLHKEYVKGKLENLEQEGYNVDQTKILDQVHWIFYGVGTTIACKKKGCPFKIHV